MQWVIVWLMGLIASGIAYQIVDNTQNAVTRSQVQELIEHDKSRVQPYQIDELKDDVSEINSKVTSIEHKQTTIQHELNSVIIYKPYSRSHKTP